MSFMAIVSDAVDDMLVDSVIDVAGDIATDAIGFVEDPSWEGAVELVAAPVTFGTQVGQDMVEDAIDMVEEEIDPSEPTSSTTAGVTNIYNYYYGCPPCSGGGVFENAFDYENEEEEITFEVEDPRYSIPVQARNDPC